MSARGAEFVDRMSHHHHHRPKIGEKMFFQIWGGTAGEKQFFQTLGGHGGARWGRRRFARTFSTPAVATVLLQQYCMYSTVYFNIKSNPAIKLHFFSTK